MHVLLSYNCVLTVVKYTDMLCYVMLCYVMKVNVGKSVKTIYQNSNVLRSSGNE